MTINENITISTNENYRTVKFKYYDKNSEYYTPEGDYSNQGIFHCWGYEVLETSDSIAQFSVALVETESGEILQVPPHCIKFDLPLFEMLRLKYEKEIIDEYKIKSRINKNKK
jgi:hypothetical protein